MQQRSSIAIIGAGPAALMAAEKLASSGHGVDIYDAMPSPARKLLIAGRGGLNLTHSEPLDVFLARYGAASDWLATAIREFPPQALRDWCEGLGEETFVGSSGRVFPRRMKAVTLLRAWLKRLDALGVRYHPRHHWTGWDGDALQFATPTGTTRIMADATLLALGGASWPRLGSDGSWVNILADAGVEVAPLQPANCGFLCHWSPYVVERFAGHPIKPVAVSHLGIARQGEAMITAAGIEGGVIYALSAAIRDAIAQHGSTQITLDLRPTLTLDALRRKLGNRGNKSLSSYLKSANFSAMEVALLHETMAKERIEEDPAACIKTLPLTLHGTTGIARAISSAGGISRKCVNASFMLTARPGLFAAGEMLDWEAPTGGYLLQACFSTGVAAANGIMDYLRATDEPSAPFAAG